ncbi:ParB/RepB/Spo0J family partition protein [Parasalinivibrio latis]|uniref:ParB/RepB/Spo0J family partition protein n=1 Tax=Parasalinivibrio latis TaxID=2952610 RepID=UPI0030E381BA
MNATKRGLGKGLDALLSTSARASEKQASAEYAEELSVQGKLVDLVLGQLKPGSYQPRQDMDTASLEELAESIRAQGVIQPLVVRQVGSHEYEIIAGERRWRASKLAGLTKVPCIVREFDDRTAGAVALIENIQREDLNAMDTAEALDRLINDFQLTHQQVADALGKSRTTISNLLRLNGLHAGVKTLLSNRQIEMGHARALLSLDGEAQLDAALQIVNRSLTVRQTETLVKKLLEPVEKSKSNNEPEILPWQQKLIDKLGTPVQVSQRKNGSGKLVIEFDQQDKLKEILALLGEEV